MTIAEDELLTKVIHHLNSNYESVKNLEGDLDPIVTEETLQMISPELSTDDRKFLSEMIALRHDYLKWVKSQSSFARGRATIMEERIYYPLKAMGLILKQMQESHNVVPGTQIDLNQALSKVMTFTRNFEKIFCRENSYNETWLGDIRRENYQNIIIKMETLRNLSVSFLVNHLDRKIRARNGAPRPCASASFRSFVEYLEAEVSQEQGTSDFF